MIADVDLAGAELERLTFDQCTLTNVRFDGATFNDIGFVGCDVVACSFDRARILGGALSVGAVNKFLPVPVSTAGRFTDCSFDRAVVDDPVCSRAIFRRCRFTAGTVRSVIFSGCVFHDVTISGRVRQVEFDGRVPFAAEPDWDRAEVVDVDFSEATRFDDVEFHDVGLTRVSWPARVRHLAFTGDVPGFFRRDALAHHRGRRTSRAGHHGAVVGRGCPCGSEPVVRAHRVVRRPHRGLLSATGRTSRAGPGH